MYQEIDDDIYVNQPVVITIPQELQHHFIEYVLNKYIDRCLTHQLQKMI